MYQYTNKHGETFGITQAESSSVAYVNGSYVAQVETEKELEDVLDHFSHADIKKTLDYTGITREKTAD